MNISSPIAFLMHCYLASDKKKERTNILNNDMGMLHKSPLIVPVADNNLVVVPVFNPSTNCTSFCCPFRIDRFIPLCQQRKKTAKKSIRQVT